MITAEETALTRQCLEWAREAGAQKSRMTLSKSVSDLVDTLDGGIDKVTHCFDCSMGINLFVDGRFGIFSANRLSPEYLRQFIFKAVDTVRMLTADRFRDLPDPSRTEKGAAAGTELGLWDSGYADVTPQQRISMALDFAVAGKLGECTGYELISEEGEYSDSEYDTLIMDSNGLECRHLETSFEYGVEVTVQDAAGDRFSGYWWDAAPMLRDLHAEGCGLKAVRDAAARIGQAPQQSGKYNMVVDTEFAGRMIKPVIRALNAYALQQNDSFLGGSLGRKIFSEGLTLRDSCRAAGQTGSRLFDSEGVATREHEVISKGVVNEYFVNTYMSGKMGTAPTVEDITRAQLMPWPKPGLGRDDILKMCGEGILVTGFNGGNSSPSTGDFSFGVEGFAFKDGRITHPVSEMLITGNMVELWNSLLAVGDDARACMSKLIPTLAFANVDFSG